MNKKTTWLKNFLTPAWAESMAAALKAGGGGSLGNPTRTHTPTPYRFTDPFPEIHQRYLPAHMNRVRIPCPYKIPLRPHRIALTRHEGSLIHGDAHRL